MSSPRKPSSSRSSQEKEAAPLSFDFEHFTRLATKNWKLLVALVVVGVVGGYLYALSQTPIYSSQATIVVNSKSGSGDGAVGQPDGISDDMIKTFEQLLQTKTLAERVVKSEHLNENPEFLPAGTQGPINEETATGMLASSTSIHIRPLTRLIDISVQHPSPDMAQKLANAVAQASIDQEMEQHNGGANVLSEYLDKEVDRLREKLAASESKLKAYDAAHNIIESNDNNVAGQTSGDARLADLNKAYIEAQNQVQLLQERYGPEHPKLIQAIQTRDELASEVAKAQGVAVQSSGDNSDYTALKSDVDSDRAQLESMEKEQKATEVSAHVEIPGIAIAEEASRPYVPISPSKRKSVAIGGFAGLLCGLGYILALYFIDGSIRTVSQAESTLGVPVIAAIPIQADTAGRSVLPTYSDPQSFVAESFRGLRASLILHDRQNPVKTVLVVSAIPGEGKSFCAGNLAVAFAQAGLKTLLIDADLRLPTLHTYFNLPANVESNGFQDVLSGRSTLEAAVVASPIPTLSLLLTTSASDSPAEVLSGVDLPNLLAQAAQKYDRIVIDSAPLNAVSDTMLIMQHVNGILLVVRAGQTPASESKAALQKVTSNGMKPMGLILNYLAAHTLKSYAYGYSYGQKPKEKNAK
jgi:capsular exopolysaccharide synthesis family protein